MRIKKSLIVLITCAITAIICCFGLSACVKNDNANKYTLTFVTNGAAEIAPITAVAGEDITPPANPEKAGYVFQGWYEQEDFSGSAVTIPTKMPDRNITYYANFTAVQTAVLKVDFGGVKEDEQHTLAVGINVSEFLKDIDTSSDKAAFDGWYIDNSPLSESYTLNSNGATVKAAWNVSFTLNVYREVDGEYAFDKTETLSGRLGETPALESYGGTGYVLKAGTDIPKLTLGENSIDAYYDLATYTVTYVIDNTDFINGFIREEYKYNQTMTVKDCTVEREGYRFFGWATEFGKAPSGPYTPNQKVVVTGSVSLYACWNRAYTQEDGTDVIWLNPLANNDGWAKLVTKDGEYEGDLNGDKLTFDVDGKKVRAKISDAENFTFIYGDEHYGFYVNYDYIDGQIYNNVILYLDGFGEVTYNTVDLTGGLKADYFGKYELTEYNDFKFTIIDIVTAAPATDANGNEQFFYFAFGEYDGDNNQITGTFTIQGLESDVFMLYDNGELAYDTLSLNGYGAATLYAYDVGNDEYYVFARGKYKGTENYESEFGEWEFTADDGSERFKFILSSINGGSSSISVYIIFNEQLFGEYVSENGSTLYLDGYGSALYTTMDGSTLEGIAVAKEDFVTFYAYSDDGNVGTIYFNLNKNDMTFTQNDTGFNIVGTVLEKYVGTSAIIEIPDEVTEIGDSAFHYIDLTCTIISVTIPASVTKIGERAFENNRTLRRVYVKGTTPCELGDKAFDWVGGDFVIVVPDESVALYRSAAGWSKYAEYIYGEEEISEKPEFEIENGVLVRYNRKDITGSVELTIPDNVTEIAAGVFRGITYITAVNLNNVTKVGEDAFALCINLESVICPNVTEICESAFLECTALESITLPKIQTIGTTAFSACYGLKLVTLGEDIQLIGDMAFRECAISYTVKPDGSEVIIPEYLFVRLTGSDIPDMGGSVFYGTQSRIWVENITVALSCFENLGWKKYVGSLYIASGEEKGVYYDIENLQTLVLDGRAIVYSMEVWLYAIEDNGIRFYIYDSDDDTLSYIDGTIENGEITLSGEDGSNLVFVKDGKVLTYTDKDENTLAVTLGGGDENTISYTASAVYNGKQVDLIVQSRKIYFNLEGYSYEISLYNDLTFTAKKSLIAYTVHLTAEDGSELNVTFGSYMSVTGTFKNINGEERTASTIGTWSITEKGENVYVVTVQWKSDKYLVTVTVSGGTFTYEWVLNLIATSYPDNSTGNGVIVYTNAQGAIVDIHLMIKGADGVKTDVSKDFELKGDGTYVFVVNETVERYDEENKEVIVEPSPYNGTYTVTLDLDNRTCEIIYKNSI